MKATPITQRAKSTPFKMNQGLVDGAKEVYGSKTTGFEKKEEVEVATENNQQPVIPTTGEDGTTGDNTEKTDAEKKAAGEAAALEATKKKSPDYKPEDAVGSLLSMFSSFGKKI
jgi:hypothetical protein